MAKLLVAGQIKPRLRRELRFVPEEITDWEDRDFLPVFNKSRSEGVLIASLEPLKIMPFRLQKRTANAMEESRLLFVIFVLRGNVGQTRR